MQTTVITNSSFLDEYKDLDLYREFGAALDENDVFVAQAFEEIKYRSWVSIRNISDLPYPREDQKKGNDQYDSYGLWSSINGAFAVWGFIMGHQ